MVLIKSLFSNNSDPLTPKLKPISPVFSFINCGLIYILPLFLIIYSLNVTCSQISYLLSYIISAVNCGILFLVWFHGERLAIQKIRDATRNWGID